MKNKFLHIIFASLFLGFSSSAITQNQELSDSVEHTVFLIGDAGGSKENSIKILDALLQQVKPIEKKSTIIFLGDNIYPGGMPHKNDSDERKKAEKIAYQPTNLKQSKAKTYYIPGNHDWNNGSKNGLSHLLNEEQFFEKKLNDNGAFIPSNGCPGPIKINISNNLVLIAIDTQWWLHKHNKGNCDSITTSDIINNLKTILNENKNKNVLVVGHHPFYSKGSHGGYYKLKKHIFPLTNINKNLYIPLPIIGSIYPLYRKWFGKTQDLAHPKYKKMINELVSVFEKHNKLIYAAGHEHNLQYHEKGNQHYIISGSGSKLSAVKRLKSPNFSAKQKGYFKLSYFKNGIILIETFGIIEGTKKLLFQKRILSLD